MDVEENYNVIHYVNDEMDSENETPKAEKDKKKIKESGTGVKQDDVIHYVYDTNNNNVIHCVHDENDSNVIHCVLCCIDINTTFWEEHVYSKEHIKVQLDYPGKFCEFCNVKKVTAESWYEHVDSEIHLINENKNIKMTLLNKQYL